MKVTIVGGGNIGMCLAGEISRVKGYDVTIYASAPEQFDEQIMIVDDEKRITYKSGAIKATDNINEAIGDADVIMCTFPSSIRKGFIQKAECYIKSGSYLGFFPGYGGAEFYCNKLVEKGVKLFALQKVPYVARTKERGKIAGLMSKKQKLLVAALPHRETENVAQMLEDMLLVECIPLRNYMAATLLPGNPLLHTSGSAVYLKDYAAGQILPEQIYYYRSWTDECSKLICAFSDEMKQICDALPIDLTEVQSIQEYYESPTPEELTAKFHSIPSFYPLVLPMKKEGNGFVPDFTSRFYTEDIPYGVCILKALALIAEVKTPVIDYVLRWYNRMTGKEYFDENGNYGKDIDETAIPQLFGLKTGEDILRFYMR